MFKIPLKAKVEIKLSVESPVGNGLVIIEAPVDVDGDGREEEIRVRVDLPGRLLDFDEHIKIDAAKIGAGVLETAASALEGSGLAAAGEAARILRQIADSDETP